MFDGWDLVGEVRPGAGRFQVVEIGGRRLAVPLVHVRGHIPVTQPTPVPRSPAWIRGVVMIRGQLVPVIDAGERLEGPSASSPRRLLLIEIAGEPILVGVDRIAEVIEDRELERRQGDPLIAGYVEDGGGDALPVLDFAHLAPAAGAAP
jgi:chemotaxis signal transduction protein